jgi:hypothetical protein
MDELKTRIQAERRDACERTVIASLEAFDLRVQRSVADIPDAELLGRVVRSVTRKRPRRQEFAWVAVMEAFGLGSTYAAQLCRRFGLDPDTGADLKTPNDVAERPGTQ